MAAANDRRGPDQRIVLRIGINLGDVIVEGDDLYGDGVNIAARLEALAEPGASVISGRSMTEVRGKVDVAFDDLGEQQLKNIDAAGARLSQSPATRQAAGAAGAGRRQALDRRSALRQYERRSGAAIISATASPRTSSPSWRASASCMCVARNSSFRYRGQRSSTSCGWAASSACDYLVEGSVRRLGDAHPHHRAADRRRDRPSRLGGELRPRPERDLRRAGPGGAHHRRDA